MPSNIRPLHHYRTSALVYLLTTPNRLQTYARDLNCIVAVPHTRPDALPLRHPRLGAHSSLWPPRLLFIKDSDGQPLPLPGGPQEQLAVQPSHKVLRCEVLGIHGCVRSGLGG